MGSISGAQMLAAVETRGKAARRRRSRPTSSTRISRTNASTYECFTSFCGYSKNARAIASAPPRSAPGRRRSRLTVRSERCLSNTWRQTRATSWRTHGVLWARCGDHMSMP